MIVRWLNKLRCRVAVWILRRGWAKSIFLARLAAPGIDSLVAGSPRRPSPLPLPGRSHLVYHQASVDPLCLRNSLESLAAQIPREDEVLVLDVGGSASAEVISPFARHAWRGYSACETPLPEQRSYTYGLNAAMAGLKAPVLIVWRTDYVYPPGMMDGYLRSLGKGSWFSAPYDVLVGNPNVDSRFVREEWARVEPFDLGFWEERSKRTSLYETQDPALFAIRRGLWDAVGGLNHQLWGYGWQFAEFAARVRLACPARRIDYFPGPPPLHQTHGGSLMHQSASGKDEAQAGVRKFQEFLGGEDAYEIFRLKQLLPPKNHP
jgi:hypothetical protein